MRRTEAEFKAEVLRRSEAYRRARAKKRRNLIGIGVCACLCVAILSVFDLLGAASEAPVVLMDSGKSESAISYQSASGKDEVSAENDAAPMEPEEAMGAPKFDPALADDSEKHPAHDTKDAVSTIEEPHAEEVAAVEIMKGNQTIRLNDADAELIAAYLAGEWIPSAANCLCDYTLAVNGMVYHYHSDCGTIQDESGHSLTLDEASKQIFNEILGNYTD